MTDWVLVDLPHKWQAYEVFAPYMLTNDIVIAGSYVAWHCLPEYKIRPSQSLLDLQDFATQHSPVFYSPAYAEIMPVTIPGDIDIFCTNLSVYDKMESALRNDFKATRLSESSFSSTWVSVYGFSAYNTAHLMGHQSYALENLLKKRRIRREPLILPNGNNISSHMFPKLYRDIFDTGIVPIPINLIKPRFGSTREEILNHFDFYQTKICFAGNSTQAYAHSKTMESFKTRQLQFSNPEIIETNPFLAMLRLLKYTAKGYKSNYLEVVRLTTNCQEKNITDFLTPQQSKALISYFGQLKQPEYDRSVIPIPSDWSDLIQQTYGMWQKQVASKR